MSTLDIGGEVISLARTAEMLPLIASSIFDFATNITLGVNCLLPLQEWHSDRRKLVLIESGKRAVSPQIDIGGELVSLAQTAEMLSLVASSIFDFATNTQIGQEA
ncbi:hypothetical protein [Ktedonobacter racemifer]|uniref:hypothetical protein n=1 Tax=Ktedonobacter racemifer TaxID=363277 RepID=UPI0012FADC63|nr:hypothetical protein [Ktedonobacter racemifer]